jgi:NAD(P)-dependent dehydrogenase (short-subunit alcohol dehydrogenase family)
VIVTPFGFASIADDVVDELDLSGKQVIVTGGASGIGLETARALANAGATVTLAVRNLDSGEKAAADIGVTSVRVRRLDLADRASIGEFVAKWTEPLHVLVNNAGVAAKRARIVSVSSSANMIAPVFFDDLHFNSISFRTRRSSHMNNRRRRRYCLPSRRLDDGHWMVYLQTL